MKRLLAAAVGTALVATTPLATTASAATTPDKGDDVSGQTSSPDKDSTFAEANVNPDVAFGQQQMARAAEPTIPSRIRAKSRNKFKYKQRIRIVGAVQAYPSTTDGTCEAYTWCNIRADGDQVALLRKMAGSDRWKILARKSPNDYGRFVFKTRSKGNATYGIVYGGTASIKRSSASKRIIGTRNPHLHVRERSGKVIMSGRVTPGWKRKRVLVQRSRRAHGTYRTWAKPRTNRYGKFSIRLVAPRSGKWHYRLVVPKTNKRFNRYVSGSWGVYRRYN